ncbi:protein ZINC INDUCED FACILITATOR 1-like [Humulus lupulus]|uniref:protein ZINC INDUCED FACILITATOR 1-like n=1 Tax=Humulus lupulus TaxID=3486 RepID=UPI002B40F100|nr:protein ZINC INDUCED FACILITATOR 1-like [Humulus lupulus]
MGENGEEESMERVLKYHPNCPGCKVDLYKISNKGYPFRELTFIWIVVLSCALPIVSLFPYLYFMIRDLNIAKREEDIGYYAGFVGASYMLGRALVSIYWGRMADRYGRKPVIIIGLATVVIFNTLFGLNLSYWMAITTRFLLGCFSGALVAIRAYATEIFREEHQALGLSTVTTAWGIGLIIGPAIGGFLVQPAEKYPNIFSKNSFLGRFPYFLPCLCISAMAFVVLIVSCWCPETLHNHNNSNSESIESLETPLLLDGNSGNGKKSSKKSLLKNWPLMSAIIAYCVFCLHDMAYSEIFSLWAVSPKKFGGLSYSTEQIGEVLAISGFSMIISQTFLYPYLAKLMGTILVSRVAGILSIPLLAGYPFLIAFSGVTLWILLNVSSLLKNALSLLICTSLTIMQNRAVDQDQRGAANGIAMTTMSLAKAVGPSIGGVMISWAQTRLGASILPGMQMVFFILNVIELIGVFMTFKPFLTTP